MAAVTIVSRKPNVAGAKKQRLFIITGGNGDTLDTRMKNVNACLIEPGTNSPTVAAQSVVGGYITLTFTTGGAFTAIRIIVIGN